MGNKISTIAAPKQKVCVSYPVHDKNVETPSNDHFEDFVEIKNENLVDLTDPTLEGDLCMHLTYMLST